MQNFRVFVVFATTRTIDFFLNKQLYSILVFIKNYNKEYSMLNFFRRLFAKRPTARRPEEHIVAIAPRNVEYFNANTEKIIKDMEIHLKSLPREETNWYFKLIELSVRDYPKFKHLTKANAEFVDFIEKEVFVEKNGVSPQRKSRAKIGDDNTEKVTIFNFALASFKDRYYLKTTDKKEAEERFVTDLKQTLEVAGYSINNDCEDRIMLGVMGLKGDGKYEYTTYQCCCEDFNRKIDEKNRIIHEELERSMGENCDQEKLKDAYNRKKIQHVKFLYVVEPE